MVVGLIIVGACRVLRGQHGPQPTVQTLEAKPLISPCLLNLSDSTIATTDVVTVEPSFQFEVEFAQPSCLQTMG